PHRAAPPPRTPARRRPLAHPEPAGTGGTDPARSTEGRSARRAGTADPPPRPDHEGQGPRPGEVFGGPGAPSANAPGRRRGDGSAPAPRPGTSATPRRALPLRVPEGKALGAELALGRALRPLKQYRPNLLKREIDEVATATVLADTRLPDVITRPARERWLDLALIVDDGLSMLLWRRLAVELRTLLQRSGAFRMVRVHGLRSRGAGTPALRAKPYAPDAAELPAAAVCDPSGRTLVLIVSDGVGSAWRDGRMAAVLERWAAQGPTAVVHALPPRLWAGSAIRAERWRVTTRRPGAANADWTVSDPVLPAELAGFRGVPVPVLEPAAGALAQWARLVSSPGGTALLPLLARPRTAPRGATGTPPTGPTGPAPAAGPTSAPADGPEPGDRPASPDRAGSSDRPATPDRPASSGGPGYPDPPASPDPSGRTAATGGRDGSSAEQELRRLRWFRDAASPEAYRLAAHLAAVAPLSVPVMRLVQSSVEWRADTGHLAEVFLGGLMRPATPPPAAGPEPLPAQHRTFTFAPETQQALLDAVPPGELLRTGERVGNQLERLAGRSPDFPAWLAHPEGSDELHPGGLPFARVERRLAERFGLRAPEPEAVALPGAVNPGYGPWLSLLPDSPRKLGPYTVVLRLEPGLYTTAYLGVHPDGGAALLHTVPHMPPEISMPVLYIAAEALRRMDGRHAPRLLAERVTADPPWIAQELLDDPLPLPVALERQRWDGHTAFAVARQLAEAVHHCLRQGMVHGDLSAPAVHLVGTDVYLMGWSAAAIDAYSPPMPGRHPGTPRPADNIHDLGELLCAVGGIELPGRLPGAPDPPRWRGGQWQPLRQVIDRCLDPDSARRPSIEEVLEVFDRYERIDGPDGSPVFSPPRPESLPPSTPPRPGPASPAAPAAPPQSSQASATPPSIPPQAAAPPPQSPQAPAATPSTPARTPPPMPPRTPKAPADASSAPLPARLSGILSPTVWLPLSDSDPVAVGPYRLLGRLNPAPDTCLYLADQSGTPAALRTLPPDTGQGAPSFREYGVVQLDREAKALRRMAGRYAPRLLEAQVHRPVPYVAREFFRDTATTPVATLTTFLATRPELDPYTAADLGRGVAEAVSLCASLGMVHGNLSTDTVLVANRRVKLIGWVNAVIDGHRQSRLAVPTAEDDVAALGEILALLGGARRQEPAPTRADFDGTGLDWSGSRWADQRWEPLRQMVARCLAARRRDRPDARTVAEALTASSTLRPPPSAEPLDPACAPETAPGPGPLDLIRAPLASSRHIAVMSFRPEAGKAVTTMALGAVFAALRDDRAIAFDATWPGSTLSERARQAASVPSPRARFDLFQLLDSGCDLWRYTRNDRGRLDLLVHGHPSSVVTKALNGPRYGQALALLREDYRIVLSEAGANTARAASLGVFDQADQLVIVCPVDDDGESHRALTRLLGSRHAALARQAVVAVTAVRGEATPAAVRNAVARYTGLCRAVATIPFDPELWSTPEVDLGRLAEGTLIAFVHLAALVAEDFPPGPARPAP
ncbi:SAV_2336 N-terminal domain-related protein, partial [Streptomyces palmae]